MNSNDSAFKLKNHEVLVNNISQMRWIPENIKAGLRPVKKSIKSALYPFGRKLADRNKNPYATHIPVLMGLSRLLRIRRVLEFGCGEYSTLTFLNKDIFPDLIFLSSFENDPEWGEKVRVSVNNDARISLNFVNGPISNAVENVDISGYDMILIDDSNTIEQRVGTIRQVAEKIIPSQFVLIHDYECKEYQKATKKISYRFIFDSMNPNTGLVCNKFPVDEKKLKRIQFIMKNYCREIPSDDITQWAKVFNREL